MGMRAYCCRHACTESSALSPTPPASTPRGNETIVSIAPRPQVHVPAQAAVAFGTAPAEQPWLPHLCQRARHQHDPSVPVHACCLVACDAARGVPPGSLAAVRAIIASLAIPRSTPDATLLWVASEYP
eukprot:365042-Chlamydomonas_euryale.AAC.12